MNAIAMHPDDEFHPPLDGDPDLTFTASAKAHLLGKGHLDQPGRYQGRIVLHERKLNVQGQCLNKLGVPLDPNMLSINCLTEWEFDGVRGYGEDHENSTPAEGRAFFREYLGFGG